MKVTAHLCMPEGDAMRRRFGELMELVKRDNRNVIAAMRANGDEVPETMADLGLQYVPEGHRTDADGEPILDIFGVREMVARGTFSCGDGGSWESAVLEEIYGVPTLCIAVAQGDDDLHGIFVTPQGAVDPVANFLSGRRQGIPRSRGVVAGSACILDEEGRVVCFEEDICAVGEDGTWTCPAVPGLSGRRTPIGRVQRSPNGQAWARTRNGAVVPVRRPS